MNCEQVRNQELVEKYVTGQLREPEMSVFEEHYFGCDECLQAVQLGQALIHGGKAAARNVIEMPGPRPRAGSRWMYGAAAAAAAIAVALVGWQALGPRVNNFPAVATREPVVTPKVPEAVPAAVSTNAPAPALIASNLGDIVPLAYRASVLRGGEEEASQRFQQAMQAYVKHDYPRAAANLAAIPVGAPVLDKPEDHVTDAGVQLYLGISQLMVNHNSDAIGSLRRSSSYGDTPYLESASFYLAKGLIREKRFAEAGAELQRVIRLNGDRQDAAAKLLEQLNQLRAR